MKTIKELFDQEFNKMHSRNWDCIYVFVDIHDTIMKSTFSTEVDISNCYDNAIEALQVLSQQKDIKLFLWTSCNIQTARKYIDKFEKLGVKFLDVNRNYAVSNSRYACYDSKPYFNICLDDKCGFDPHKDWLEIREYFKNR